MAYDEDLADRVRGLVDAVAGIEEQPMFGGLAFLIGGNLALSVSGRGGLLVRVDPADADTLVARTGAAPATMGGRTLQGWLRVAPERLRTRVQLAAWVRRGVDFAGALPPKGRSRQSGGPPATDRGARRRTGTHQRS